MPAGWTGADPVLLGYAVVIFAIGALIKMAGPELREWVCLLRGTPGANDLSPVPNEGHKDKPVRPRLNAPEDPPEKDIPLAG